MTNNTCETCQHVHERVSAAGSTLSTCVAHKADGEPCRNWPIKGGTVCDQRHGGRTPQVRAKAAERVETERIRQAATRLGVPRDVDAVAGIIELVTEAAGNVAFYRSLVEQLDPGATVVDEDDEGRIHLHGLWERTLHQSGRPTGEAKPHVLIQLYNEERDRFMRYSAVAVKVGIDERRLRIEEAQVRVLFAGVAAACAAQGMSTDDALAFRRAFAAYIRNQVELNPELAAG